MEIGTMYYQMDTGGVIYGQLLFSSYAQQSVWLGYVHTSLLPVISS